MKSEMHQPAARAHGQAQADLATLGFSSIASVLSADQLLLLIEAIGLGEVASGTRRRRGSAYAIRHLLWERPQLNDVLAELGLNQLAGAALGDPAFPISATFFDKNQGANWMVAPHQDLVMPVENRIDEPGFLNWTVKLGTDYVEPPLDVLANLVALRVHVDECSANNGALAIVPGSHLRGKLLDHQIVEIPAEHFLVCSAAPGDALLLRPLIVHRSSKAAYPSNRRVLHVVYATQEPGEGVRWKRHA